MSEEWINEADAALRASGLRAANGGRFAVEQHVGELVYHLVFDLHRAYIGLGPVTDPTVVFKQSRDTAGAIARGELSAEEAVLNGEVTFEGDPMALVANNQSMTGASDIFAELRERTVWDESPD